jgi:hypothetical protein
MSLNNTQLHASAWSHLRRADCALRRAADGLTHENFGNLELGYALDQLAKVGVQVSELIVLLNKECNGEDEGKPTPQVPVATAEFFERPKNGEVTRD